MRFIVPLIAAMALTTCTAGSAANPPVHLTKGQVAPFDGEFVESPYLRKLLKLRPELSRARGEMRKLQASLDRAQKATANEKAERRIDATQAQAQSNAFTARVAALETALRDATRPTPFLLSPEFLVPATAVVTAVITALVIVAVD